MSNYPPGVTGNEWQIAGPDAERDETRDVKECGNAECEFEGGTVEGVVTFYGFEAWFDWECPECGHSNEEDVSEVYAE